jgi:hypothetical protein
MLKEFLKGDEGAVTYRNVEVEFIHGRKATMTIYNDGEEVDKFVLSEYESEGQEAMHKLFQEKGFEQLTGEELSLKIELRDEKQRKADEEKEALRRQYREEQARKEEEKKRKQEAESNEEL